MTSTKRSAIACKLTDSKVTKGEYGKLCKQSRKYADQYFAVVLAISLAAPKRRGARAAALEPIPPPHAWPAWGGKCWVQAMAEMMAMMPLGYAASFYLMLMSDPSASVERKNEAYLNYVTARTLYLNAWDGMENCLVVTV